MSEPGRGWARQALKMPAPCVCTDTPLCNQHQWVATALQAAYDAGVAQERARCATFIETVDWKLLPRDAFPMSRSRFILALTDLLITVADALRAPSAPSEGG